MKVIAMTGKFTEAMMEEVQRQLPEGFTAIEVRDASEFHKLADVDYLVVKEPKIRKDTIETLNNAKLIQRWGAGWDSVDIEDAGRKGIAVAITPGANAPAVAELTIALILAVYRNIVTLHNYVHEGKWETARYIDLSYMIKDKVVGLIGCGAIGIRVAKIIQAFEGNVVYYDPFRMSEEREKELGIKYVPLEELYKTADIISLHCPATPETIGMINKDSIALMKETAVIINSARGVLINTPDLVEALKTHRILGAGLDAFVKEPLTLDDPLLSLENVVITSHIGGNTSDIAKDMIARCFANIVRVENGEPIPARELVNGQYLNV